MEIHDKIAGEVKISFIEEGEKTKGVEVFEPDTKSMSEYILIQQ